MNAKKIVSRILLTFVAISLIIAIADAAGLRQKFFGKTPTDPKVPATVNGKADADAPHYAAIFYHAKHRCDTCVRIEEYAHAALQPAIDAGEIAWEVSEYTAPENRELVRSMDVITSTVVLAERVDGTIVRFRNLEDVWLHVNKPDRFSEFMKGSWKSFQENL